MAVTEGNILVEAMNVSWGGTDLGATSGGVTVTPTVNTVEITADQLGAQRLDEVQNGTTVEVSMTLQEMTAAQWASIVGSSTGDNHTPVAGTQVTGYGESKNFTNLSASALELVLKPVGAVNDLRNLHFHKAYPIPGSISYSGDEVSSMEVTFRVIRDTTKDSKINLFVFGDGTQDLT